MQYFMNRHYIWPHSKKFTRDKLVFCSRRVYFSPDSNSTYKTFLCLSIKRKTEFNTPFIWKVLQYLQVYYMNEYIRWHGLTDDHMIDGMSNYLNRIFCTSVKMFVCFYFKNVNNVNFSFTKMSYSHWHSASDETIY